MKKTKYAAALNAELDQRKEHGVACLEVTRENGGHAAVLELIRLCCDPKRRPISTTEVEILRTFANIGMGVCLEIYQRREQGEE